MSVALLFIINFSSCLLSCFPFSRQHSVIFIDFKKHADDPSKSILNFVSVGFFGFVFETSLALLLILYDFHSLLQLPMCSSMVSILLVRAVSILNPVVLNSHSDNSNIFAMSGFDALSLQVIFFAS